MIKSADYRYVRQREKQTVWLLHVQYDAFRFWASSQKCVDVCLVTAYKCQVCLYLKNGWYHGYIRPVFFTGRFYFVKNNIIINFQEKKSWKKNLKL